MLTSTALLLLAPSLLPAQATAPAVLADTVPDPEGRFGADVAISGSFMVVGAPGVPAAGAGRGAVLIFRSVLGAWQLDARIAAPALGPDAGFGDAVDISTSHNGTFLIVGAPRATGSPVPGTTGAALIYERAGTSWQLSSTLRPVLGPGTFGSEVAIDSTAALITQSGDGGRVFASMPPGGQPQELIRPSGVFNSSEFGQSLDLFGDLAVVGAPGEDALGYDSGAAYVYRQASPTLPFLEEARLEHPSAATVTNHGFSVAAAKTAGPQGLDPVERVLVGSLDGAAFMWWRPAFSTNSWAIESVLNAFDGEDGGFGMGVALDGERALVGAPYRDLAGQNDGVAFDFQFEGAPGSGEWKPHSLLHPGTAAAGDFGSQVALDGGSAAVSAIEAFTQDTDSGRVLVYELGQRLGESHCASRRNSTGSIASLSVFGSSVASDLSLGFDVVGLPPFAAGYALTSALRGQSPNLGGGSGDLCLGGQVRRLSFFLQASDADGAASVTLDFNQLPPGLIIAPGTTWSFQWWHRDTGPAGPTSGTSHAVEMMFE